MTQQHITHNISPEDDISSEDDTSSQDDISSEDQLEDNENFNNIKISPLAKRLALLKKIDVREITGSGPRGRIIKKDLDFFLNNLKYTNKNISNFSKSETEQSSIKIPLTNIRKTIAKRLQESKQSVPHFYLKSKICVNELIKTRKLLNRG